MERQTEVALEQLETKRLERANRHRPVTRKMVAAAVRAAIEKVSAERSIAEDGFSFSKALRGMLEMRGEKITDESEAAYARALQSGTTPGSYLVPQVQANDIIEQLAQQSIARLALCRVWNMRGIQALTVPTAVTSPTIAWVNTTSRQLPDSAATFGQLSFQLKQQQAMLEIPLQLLKVSSPSFDVILASAFAAAIAESEDAALFATSTQAGAAPAIMSAAGITTLNCGNSANGANLSYTDIINMLAKAAALKLKGPLAWFASPRTLYQRLCGLTDAVSRPLLLPDPTEGGSGFSLFGFPVFVSASISETESLGSGSNQSHLILCKPTAIHIGEASDVQMDVAMEAFFDSAQVGLRIGHWVDAAYGPAAAIIALLGIN